MPYKCPHCEEKIESCTYNISGYEYGNYDIASQNYDYQDSCHEGDTTYECPECGQEIEDPDDLEEFEEEEEEEDKTEDYAPIRTPQEKETLLCKDNNTQYRNITRCKKCGQGYEFQNDEKVAECSVCGIEIKRLKHKQS